MPAPTETIIGRWFAQGGGRREKVVLATKLYGAMSEWPNDGRLSARHIRMACDDSLRRMQTDHIDLYQMHHVDRTAPWDEIWQAMDTLVQQGKIIYVGSSNFAGWHIAQANERGHGSRLARPRQRAEPLQPAGAHGRARGAAGLPRLRRRRDPVEPAVERAARWRARRRTDVAAPVAAVAASGSRSCARSWRSGRSLCAELGEEPAAVALAWLLHQDGVTCPIIGPRTMDQLDGASLRALDIIARRADTLAAIDAIFPGPGGTAPEAYAWYSPRSAASPRGATS